MKKKSLNALKSLCREYISCRETTKYRRQSGVISFVTEKALQELKSKAKPHTVLFRSPCTVSRLCKHTAPMQRKTKKKPKNLQNAPVASRNYQVEIVPTVSGLQGAALQNCPNHQEWLTIESPPVTIVAHGCVHECVCMCVVYGGNYHSAKMGGGHTG